MKWAYQVKDKVKAAAVLAIIMCMILLTNFSERRGFANLGRSISSIYEDRLLPSTYIFGITDHLYQKRLLHSQYLHGENANAATGIQQHNAAIEQLMASYEATYLTPEEIARWAGFKTHIAGYNRQEAASLAGVGNSQQVLSAAFNSAMQELNALSRLQAGEGSNLRKSSAAIIGNSAMLSDLQVTLLIILGLFALVLLSVHNKLVFHNNTNARLN